MIQKTKKQYTKNIKSNWYASPGHGHAVQFYPDSKTLIANLREYVSTGLESGATCIVIATKQHLSMLGEFDGRYVTLDAHKALDSFMLDDLPNKELFNKNIGGLVSEAIARHGRPLRAYGEMVAILWKQGNKEAVLQLEQLWNELAKEYEFSLYCAYPVLHFTEDPEARLKISGCHNAHAY